MSELSADMPNDELRLGMQAHSSLENSTRLGHFPVISVVMGDSVLSFLS